MFNILLMGLDAAFGPAPFYIGKLDHRQGQNDTLGKSESQR